MKEFTYIPKGVCSRQITIEYDEDTKTLGDVSFVGGCNGNLKGMKIDDVIDRLEGTDCRGRGTSCPDQLAEALKSILRNG